MMEFIFCLRMYLFVHKAWNFNYNIVIKRKGEFGMRKSEGLKSEAAKVGRWERFPTAIKSVGKKSIIVVENHSHPALILT